MKNVMVRAWEIYRTLEGDHYAKLAMALKQAWAEEKHQYPVLKIDDWFLIKTATAQKWPRDSFWLAFHTVAIVGETEKAYKVLYLTDGKLGIVTLWVPKSVCSWEFTDTFHNSTKVFSDWKSGMAWNRYRRHCVMD